MRAGAPALLALGRFSIADGPSSVVDGRVREEHETERHGAAQPYGVAKLPTLDGYELRSGYGQALVATLRLLEHTCEQSLPDGGGHAALLPLSAHSPEQLEVLG
jgi:hypothetical protein